MSTTKPKPKVGDRLFSVRSGFSAKSEPTVEEVEVVRVGRKYFMCVPVAKIVGEKYDKFHESEYHLDSWREHTDTNYRSSVVYPSLQAIEDDKECRKLYSEIHDIFSYHRSPVAFGLQDLREIVAVVRRCVGVKAEGA